MGELNVFVREFEVDQCEKPLVLYQHEVGEESCVVWDAALVLASYLQKLDSEAKDIFKKKKVLELGAGVGCVGLTAACLGADVVLTDLLEVIPLLERNIETNSEVLKARGRATPKALKWDLSAEETDTEPVDILLLADCVYYNESVSPLVATMKRFCNGDTEVFICQEQRPSEKQRAIWTHFIELVTQYFTLAKIPLSDQHPRFNSPDILLFKAKLQNN